MQTETPTAYRCEACGNRTRFDVFETKTSKVFRHFSLGGDLIQTEEEVLSLEVSKVTCRWCGSSASITILGAGDDGPEMTDRR